MDSRLKEIIFEKEPYGMNWLREDFIYGEVETPTGIKSTVTNRMEGDLIYTEIALTNTEQKPIFTNRESIRISFPLADRYEDSATCLKKCCHTHIFCGDNVSYIMALRMGGEAPHLGMVLTEGGLSGYSIKRNILNQSNDRGCFLLHTTPMEFKPEETKKIGWVIFPHGGKEDFKKKAGIYSRYVDVEAERYVLFKGEHGIIRIRPSFEADSVSVDGGKLNAAGDSYEFCFQAEVYGEKTFDIQVNEVHTTCRLFIHEPPGELAKKRCQFIAEKQQYHGAAEQLAGAYLAYDNEERISVYTPENDFNGGRERIGMGLLMSRFLQGAGSGQNPELLESLKMYLEYVIRELVDVETGDVYNDIGKDDSYERLYNDAWFMTFFCELYRQHHDKKYLAWACRIATRFYEKGGADFYPISLPIIPLTRELRAAGMEAERGQVEELFRAHGNRIMERDVNYPPSEVNYEQSIVAPAADILLSMYELTGEEKYLQAGERQVKVLELFNGMQPDYHLYEVAVRHWDGYWFGKRRMYGDTFPHYWSALTGNVFKKYGRLTQNADYLKRAEDSLRGVLPMIFADGTASCAYIFPEYVNGRKGEFYDPYANDQDWGLYFYLCSLS